MPKILVNLLLFLLHLEDKHRELLKELKKRGADSVEVPLFEGTTRHYERMKKMILEVGLSTPTAVGMTNVKADLSSLNARVRKRGVAHVKKLIEWSSALGAPKLVGPLTSAWAVWPKDRKGNDLAGDALVEHMENRLEVGIPSFREVLDYAASHKVEVNFEYLIPWELPYFNTLEQAVKFLKKVNRQNAGVLIDTAHQAAGSGMRKFHFLLKELVEKKVPTHIHISAPIHRGDITESSISFFKFLSILKTLGVNRQLVIEIFNAVPPFARGARLNRRAWTYEECLAVIEKAIERVRKEWTWAASDYLCGTIHSMPV